MPPEHHTADRFETIAYFAFIAFGAACLIGALIAVVA